jgi:hypothetical protein
MLRFLSARLFTLTHYCFRGEAYLEKLPIPMIDAEVARD